MKRYLMIGVLSCLAFSCREKPAEAKSDEVPPRPIRPQAQSPNEGSDEKGALVRSSDLVGSRPAHKKREAPTAEFVPELSGHVISPFTNEVINVGAAPAGTLFFDPKHPDDEGMAFYLPVGINGAPTATEVPGKAGFVFSPYNNKIIDVRGMPPGMLIADPNYPAEEKSIFESRMSRQPKKFPASPASSSHHMTIRKSMPVMCSLEPSWKIQTLLHLMGPEKESGFVFRGSRSRAGKHLC